MRIGRSFFRSVFSSESLVSHYCQTGSAQLFAIYGDVGCFVLLNQQLYKEPWECGSAEHFFCAGGWAFIVGVGVTATTLPYVPRRLANLRKRYSGNILRRALLVTKSLVARVCDMRQTLCAADICGRSR